MWVSTKAVSQQNVQVKVFLLDSLSRY